jgi:hypothetical protein
LGTKEKNKDTHHPQLLLLPHQTENNKTTKQTRGKICNHNCTPKITPTSKTSKTIHSQNKTKQNHPQFTNKVTNFSPNLLASLNFFAGQNLVDNFC